MRSQALAVIALAASILPAQNLDRTKAPPSPPIPSFKLPPVYETRGPTAPAEPRRSYRPSALNHPVS